MGVLVSGKQLHDELYSLARTRMADERAACRTLKGDLEATPAKADELEEAPA